MNRKKICLSAIIIISISLLLMGKPMNAYADENGTTICKGVYIDKVDVSGMTEEEAQKAVDSFVEGLRDKRIAIKVGKKTAYTKLGELGYTYEENDNVQQALALGQKGNPIKRYKDLKDIENGGIVYPLTFTLDDSRLNKFIKKKVAAYNIDPVNASVKRKNGDFIYTDEVSGKKVDVAATAAVIKDAILKNWSRVDTAVEAVMEDDLPVYTRESVEQCNALLGTYTTEYASSAEGRAANLANGARLINNTVLYPGDIFSGYEHLSPFTVENGYYQAGAYSDGKVIDSIGGGACQVTTTLYNAVLFSELEIVERQSHSMTISYVDLSRDAAIAGTYKDLKFKNNTDAPILIEAYTVGRKITFKIWGHETRDTKNRRLEFKTEILSTTNPPADKVTKDPTQPTTYQLVTQAAHIGYKTELYKIIYENNVQVDKVLINKSTYLAAPRYITIGTKVVKEDPAKQDTAKTDTSKTDTSKTDTSKTDTTKTDTTGKTDTTSDQNKTTDQPKTSKTDTTIKSESTGTLNRTNPDGQIQGEIYWDPAWDTENTAE